MAEVKTEMPSIGAAETKKVEDRLAKTRETFKTQTIATITELITGLKEIGYEYELVEKGNGTTGKKNKCSNCGDLGHSARTC